MRNADPNSSFPPFQIRMPPEISKAIRLESVKHDLYQGDFIVELFAFAKKHGFLDWLKENPAKAKGRKTDGFNSYQVRVPPEISKAIRIEAVKHELYYGEFVVQMFLFAKKNGFIDTLKDK
jgi:hypothetical protein